MFFYDIGLWSSFKIGTLNKLATAYVKCIKKEIFLVITMILVTVNVTASDICMLLDLGLPSFNTVFTARSYA